MSKGALWLLQRDGKIVHASVLQDDHCKHRARAKRLKDIQKRLWRIHPASQSHFFPLGAPEKGTKGEITSFMPKCLKKPKNPPPLPYSPNNKPPTQNLPWIKTCLYSQVRVLMGALLFVEHVFRFRTCMPKAFRAERRLALLIVPLFLLLI